MSETVGVVVAIGVAIVAIVTIFIYMQVSRFCENTRVQLTRFVDTTENLEKNYSNTLRKLGEAADKFGDMSDNFKSRIEIIDRDLAPLAKNIDKTLTDANPLVRSLSESSDDLKATLKKVRITASDAADIAEGVHGVIMPVVGVVRSLVLAASEAITAIQRPKKKTG